MSRKVFVQETFAVAAKRTYHTNFLNKFLSIQKLIYFVYLLFVNDLKDFLSCLLASKIHLAFTCLLVLL